jgi:hypothetical protein
MRNIFLIFTLIILSIPIFAHSGRTDSQGGHHDRKNGGYHYHHGRGPHQHDNSKSGSSAIWYIIGIGALGYIGYNYFKKR